MKQIGNKIIQLDVVDSTNNFTANLLKAGELAHGTVILADEQTAGRGQRGANWQSEGGSNLIFTVFVEYDNLAVDRQEVINHWISLSIVEFLAQKGISSKIKWPNDILVNDLKIAGILIENQLANEQIKSSIIGIGLNVNQTNFESLNATSIRLIKEEFSSVKEVALQLISTLNKLLPSISMHQFQLLKENFHQHLWKMNEMVRFTKNGELHSGKVCGTNEQGLLQIEMNGHLEIFDLKEISFLLT